jgi:HAD superfamily hydrolase (TIGR01509 family)
VPASCVVFDFDGTILDTEEPLYLSWSELWAEHGHDLDQSFWQTLIGTDGGFDPWAALETRVGAPLDRAHLERRRLRRDGLIEERTVRPGVLEWLDGARRLEIPIGIASSSTIEWVAGHLGRLGLLDRFAALACCDDLIPAKPDPTSFRLACARLGADPRSSVAVEDSPHGVRAAVEAGLFTVAVPHGMTAGLDLSQADVVVPSLEALGLQDALHRASTRR